MNTLETKKLTKNFNGVTALRDLTLNFPEGKITGLIGPNGSGKTTLINVFSGLIKATSGTYIINGQEFSDTGLGDLSEIGISRTFQKVQLCENMTVLDNLLLVTNQKKIGESFTDKFSKIHVSRIKDVLRELGIHTHINNTVDSLSFGQKRLVEFARVLLLNTSIVLFDEPFSGLFPEMITVVKEAILKLKTEGKTIVVIEHNIELIEEIADFLIVLDAGKLIASGLPSSVLNKPEVIEAYLGK